MAPGVVADECAKPGTIPKCMATAAKLFAPRLSGHDPYAYLKDILARLPTHKNSRIDELLTHNWQTLIT